ncbi:4-hydroxyphenylacetate 3-monooxygenase [Burkholderia sp. WAC0059]|uniref:4-hydroxyphenylacetate 3-hydroxylase family protein n=1 Tax=Burkholderia sp. WAC0059 TaxID=2066022 RepID=UPI000C7F4734|nr:4-hydroxyphenylacetate 3-hydroxylase N-terminal domain-containing protein [Burkholderia sp. WAC0059]PLZ02845.1 4-hydroxyphenylacetate 3-monooxygenase [Burkholderia sp. WAC0059]
MNPRTGKDYVEALRDGRNVYIDGARVDDVTTHPAFRNTVASFANLYDFQARPENQALMTIASPGNGRRVSRAWDLPTDHAGLVTRRRALEASLRLHHGFLGRSPDHLATTLSGMVMGIEIFRRHDARRAQALADYFAHARDNDLFVSYAIQNPQADKTRTASTQARDLVARVIREEEAGIVVSGAKMLGTSSIMADELLVANIQPLRPGEERYAFSCAVPSATPGLHFLSRRSYEQAAASRFDHPLSSRLDENDAIVYFDEVRMPWHRVFLLGDIEAARRQWSDTPAHVYQNYQAQIRLSVKLQFLAGLAHRIAETTGSIDIPQVKGQIGRLAAQATLVEGLVSGMEAAALRVGDYVVPNAAMLYAAQTLTQELYPAFIQTIREISGGGLIMLPSSAADFENPAIAAMIDATQVSSATDSLGRVRLFKLAWDAIGSEFASRHLQYEMFYAGSAYVNHGNMYRHYDWPAALGQVDAALRDMGAPAMDARSAA